jgi:hypothetical protein
LRKRSISVRKSRPVRVSRGWAVIIVPDARRQHRVRG